MIPEALGLTFCAVLLISIGIWLTIALFWHHDSAGGGVITALFIGFFMLLGIFHGIMDIYWLASHISVGIKMNG